MSGGNSLDRRDMLDAGIVDDDIDLAEPAYGALHHHMDGVATGHVGAVIGNIDIILIGERGALRLDLDRIAEAVQHDGRTGPCQALCDAKADAAGRTGNDGGFSLEGTAAGPEVGLGFHDVEHVCLQ